MPIGEIPPLAKEALLPPPPFFSPKQQALIQTVGQLAVRILFPLALTLMSAAMLPIAFQAVLLPVVALGATFLSGFFFFSEEAPRAPCQITSNFAHLPKIEPETIDLVIPSEELPPNASVKGIRRMGNNCWANSLLQFIRVSPFVMRWIQKGKKVSEEIERIRAFYKTYHQTHSFLNEKASQEVRLALADMTRKDRAKPWHPITNPSSSEISRLSARQEDPASGLTLILSEMPEKMLPLMRVTTTYHTKNLPKIIQGEDDKEAGIEVIDGKRKVKVEPFSLIQLSITKENPDLRKMLKEYFYEKVADVSEVSSLGSDGQVHSYKRKSVRRQFISAPKSLFIQIKRFTKEAVKESGLHRIGNYVSAFLGQEKASSPSVVFKKNNADITIPFNIQIQPLKGPLRTYVLNGEVQHKNQLQEDSINSGHYVSFVEKNGEGYFCDDERVTRLDRGMWPLEKSYLLHYQLEPLHQEG